MTRGRQLSRQSRAAPARERLDSGGSAVSASPRRQAGARSRAAFELPDPPLRDPGAGVVLRPWAPTADDAVALAAAWADPDVAAAGRVPGDGSPAAARRWIAGDARRREKGRALDLVVVDRASGALLGEVGLRDVDPVRERAEAGWWVAAEHRGQGVATASVRLLVDWALADAGLAQVWARIAPGNAASGRVAAAAGMVRLGEADGVDVWARSVPQVGVRP